MIRPLPLSQTLLRKLQCSICTLAVMLATGCQTATHTVAATRSGDSPVIFKFVTVGDSRAEPNAPGNAPQDEIWLQSTAIWSRMLHEIEAQRPHAMVFNGDMIYGYGADAAGLDRQYAFWRGMVTGLMARGTYVLPVPGNHEVQEKFPKAGGGTIKRATAMRENVWRANMGDLILNQSLWATTTGQPATAWRLANTPLIGSDGITTDQQALSYSFDAGAVHITVVNTDPAGFDDSVPIEWLKNDLREARARGAKQFFVFGHKMPFTYHPPGKAAPKPDGLDARRELRDAFWDVIEQFGASYFCGHQHVYNASQPTRINGGKAWQVIVGTAGSPLSIKAGENGHPNERMYAWAEVSVRQNGKVTMQVRGFDDKLSATKIIEALDLS